MTETARLAAPVGRPAGFEMRDQPAPDPARGTVLIQVALGRVGGSDRSDRRDGKGERRPEEGRAAYGASVAS